MNDDRVIRLLKAAPFVGCLSDSTISELARAGQMRSHATDDVLCSRGDDGHCAMVVLSGRLKISNTTVDGKEITLNYLGVGALVGEIALLDGQPRTATVTALEPTEVFVLQRQDLLPVLESNPAASLEIIKVLCQKLRQASAMIEDSAHLMPTRVAKGLLRLANDHGVRVDDKIRIDLKLSQSEVGSYCGMTRENVNRQFRDFTAARIIEIQSRRITILDPVRLEEIAHGAPHIAS